LFLVGASASVQSFHMIAGALLMSSATEYHLHIKNVGYAA